MNRRVAMLASLGHWKVCAIIFSLSLLLRSIFGVVLLPELYRVPAGDAREYDGLARNLMAGRGLTDGTYYSHRPPAYPVFLAAVYTLFGHRYVFVRVVQSVLGSVVCVLLYWISSLMFSKTVGIASGILAAVYPPFIRFAYYGGPAFLLSENLQAFLLVLFVLLAVRILAGKETKRSLFLIGAILGLCLLTRSDVIFLVSMTPLWILFISKGAIRERVWKGIIVIGAVFMTILPWGVRNYFIHGRVIFLSTKSGATFFDGNNPQARGGGVWAHGDSAYWPEGYDQLSEIEKDRAVLREGLHFLRSNLRKVPWLLSRKLLVHWSPWVQVGPNRIYNWGFLVLSPFSAIGVFLLAAHRKWKEVSLFILLFLSTTLAAIVTFGDPRYRYPYEPYWVILAAVGLERSFCFWKKAFLK